jgi:glutamyl-Q tRNA(Asp) synthetase
VAAVGSFLDARQHGGRWLVRMEDLDTPRAQPGSADLILHTLEAFGLWWDGKVEYQSRRLEFYAEALRTLSDRGLIFRCSCSRRELRVGEGPVDETHAAPGYSGTCRNGPARPGPTALRFRIDDTAVVRFVDRIQGPQAIPLRGLGDVVVRRRDGLYAYQLAVAVDDAAQGITDVVRGADLLESTAWQIALAHALGFDAPSFAHLPVIVEPGGAKLAKSKRSTPLDPDHARVWLAQALRLLGQEPPADLGKEAPPVQLDWAVRHWRLAPLAGVKALPAPKQILQADLGT